MPTGDLQNWVHFCCLAIEVNWYDSLRSHRQRRLDQRRINVAGLLRWLNWNWLGPNGDDGQKSRDKGIGRKNDLIAGSDAPCFKNQPQGVESIAYSNTMSNSTISGKLLFKLSHFTAKDQPTGIEYAVEG